MKRCVLLIVFSLLSTHVQASIRAYFNHSPDRSYVDPYRGIKRPGDDLEKVIIDQINLAKKSIYIAVQEFRLPLVAQALVAKKRAGIDVRVVIEHDYNFTVIDGKSDSELEKRAKGFGELEALVDINGDRKFSKSELLSRDAIYMMRAAKIRIMDDSNDSSSKGSGLMHHKFMVIDGKTTIVSSANFTTSCIHGDMLIAASRGNPNSMVVMKSMEASKVFTEEFLELWGDGKEGNFGQSKTYRGPRKIKIGSTAVTIQFSPTSARRDWDESVNGLMASYLKKSYKSIKAALFVFSDQRVADVMEDRHEDGVDIGVLIEHRFAYRDYSELLDMLGLKMLNAQCSYEKGNRPWKKKARQVGIPVLPSGDLLHHKFAVVDGKTVIMGSENWTESANLINDETLIVIENKLISDQYVQEYDRLLSNSILGATQTLKDTIRDREARCSKSDFILQE